MFETDKETLSVIDTMWSDYVPCHSYCDLVCYFIGYMQDKVFLQKKKKVDTEYYSVFVL